MKLMNLFKKKYDLVAIFNKKRGNREEEYFAIREILERHHKKGEVVEIYSCADYISIKVVVTDDIQLIREDLIKKFDTLDTRRVGNTLFID